MKERFIGILKGFSGIALLALVMLLPMNLTKAEAAVTPVSLTNISSPSGVSEKANLAEGKIGTTTLNGINYYSFTISERGWVILYEHYTGGNGVPSDDYRFAICKGASFINTEKYSYNKYDVNGRGGCLVDCIFGYYLDPGTYYFRTKRDTGAEYDYYGYFLPNSVAFSSTNVFKNCTSRQITGYPKQNFSTTYFYNYKVPLPNVNYDNSTGISNAYDTYEITKNGEYTLAVTFSSDEWKDFQFMQHYTVTDLGNHPSTTQAIKKKASFTSDGSVANVCTKCKATVSTTPIYKISSIKFDKSAYTYTGKAIKPSVTLYDSKNNRISKSYYDVTLTNNKNIGKASAKITLKGSMYSGEKKASFDIVPKDTKIKSVTPGTKSVTVKWGAGSGVTGYEVQASTSSSFPNSKTKTVKVSKSNTSTTIKNLKSKTNYYVRVRTYKTVSGKKYASKWSAYKKIKVN